MAALKLLSTFLLWALSGLSTSCCSAHGIDPISMRERYERWIARYGRTYKDRDEKELRFRIYESNAWLIDSFNAISDRYKLSDNKFADLTNFEFRDNHASCFAPGRSDHPRHLKKEMVNPSSKSTNYTVRDDDYDPDLPLSIDWRDKGAVTPIKDQGQCGSCWAFSAVAAVEGLHQINTGRLVPLSEQELVDCDTSSGDSGCQGGLMSQAFEFVEHNRGLTTEADYPYGGTQGVCKSSKLYDVAATISGYANVTANSEEKLMEAAANQPVSVAVDAGAVGWQFYSKGIFAGPCGTDLDHGVAVVGYGSEGVDKYWIVKNSWGRDWGEEGYIRIKRDVPSEEGLCGIAMQPSYPLE